MIRTFTRALLGTATASLLLLEGGLLVAGPALAARAGCEDAVRDLRGGFARLRAGGDAAALDRAEADERAQRGRELYQAALAQHPECAQEFETLVAELQAAARGQSVKKPTPFLGPIGWLWNNVYYRVFNGNTVMMALFGWALLLSPVILFVSVGWVLRGAGGAFRKPHVPEHLRSET